MLTFRPCKRQLGELDDPVVATVKMEGGSHQ
jgi:hypothetical protein